jgi:hypothetical protein
MIGRRASPVEKLLRRNWRPSFAARVAWFPVACVVVFAPMLLMGAYAPGALLNFNNLSDLSNTTTARTNLGLGTAAVKAATGSGSNVVSATGTFVVGHVLTAADTSGTAQDGGEASPYNPAAVAITGGTIDGTAIGGTTPAAVKATTGNFSGILTTGSGTIHAVRVIVAAGAVTMATTDDYVVINKTTGAATTVNEVATPTLGTLHCIKDGKGDAQTNNITFTPNTGNVDGQPTYALNQNFQSNCFLYNGSQWNIL